MSPTFDAPYLQIPFVHKGAQQKKDFEAQVQEFNQLLGGCPLIR